MADFTFTVRVRVFKGWIFLARVFGVTASLAVLAANYSINRAVAPAVYVRPARGLAVRMWGLVLLSVVCAWAVAIAIVCALVTK